MSWGSKVESHMAFVDEIVFFCRTSCTIKGILHRLSSFLGLEVNVNKSYIIFSACVHDGDDLNSILRFQ